MHRWFVQQQKQQRARTGECYMHCISKYGRDRFSMMNVCVCQNFTTSKLVSSTQNVILSELHVCYSIPWGRLEHTPPIRLQIVSIRNR